MLQMNIASKTAPSLSLVALAMTLITGGAGNDTIDGNAGADNLDWRWI